MAKVNWKRVQVTSIRHAMETCIRFAREEKNLSVEQIAELMGEASHFTLYKWIESGRMPAIKIRPFEHACGCFFVTCFLAHSANKLVVEMPTGRKPGHLALSDLSIFTHSTIAMLIGFYEGSQDQADVIHALTSLLEDIAHQRGNVEKHQQPELL